MRKTTEISPGLLLHTTDRLGANRSVTAIEYELEVRKNKLVVFEIDFTGSLNVGLEGLPLSVLKKKTAVEPGQSNVVAVVNVLDPRRSWSLESKYTWIEENPGTVQPGHSKREKLAEGIILTTSRMSPPDTFAFHLSNEKPHPINVTLDCSKSVNLSMFTIDEPGSTARKDVLRVNMNQITIVVAPYSRAHVCSLMVKDPSRGYQLKTKWTWTEDGQDPSQNGETGYYSSPSSRRNSNLEGPYYGENGNNYQDEYSSISSVPKRRSQDLPYSTGMPPITSQSPPSFSQDMASQQQLTPYRPSRPSVRSSPPRPRLKREEISPSVFLETEVIDNLVRPEITYTIEVGKQTRVTFEADFSGSTNLSLIPSGGLLCEAMVDPMRRMQVARLRVMDANLPWKLVCRYKWQEEDLAPIPMLTYEPIGTGAPAPGGPVAERPISRRSSATTTSPPAAGVAVSQPQVRPRGSALNASSGMVSTVRQLLASINLEGYAEFFEAEELSLDLLRMMARDESEFRHSLEALGVNKMGHRERILVAVKNLPLVPGD